MSEMLEMRTSERGNLKRCPQRWYWSTVEGLRPHRAANPLWFGSAVHEALAGWYIPGTERGEHPAEGFDKALSGQRQIIVTNDDEEAEYVDARELGINMLNRYVEHYGLEPHKEIIAPEYQGSVILPRPEIELFGIKTPRVKNWLRYLFTWDGVYRDLETGEIWLDEHKTAASIWDEFLPLDDQAGSYWAVAGPLLRKRGVLKPGEEIAGIMYNFLRKAMGDERPRNERGEYLNKPTKKEHYIRALHNWFGEEGDPDNMIPDITEKLTLKKLQEIADIQGIEVHGDVSANQPPEYFYRTPVYRSRSERKTMLERIQNEAIFSEAYRKGWLPITKSPSTMNCRGCEFKLICELDESGDQLSVEEFKQTQYRVEDAYEAYRKSAE